MLALEQVVGVLPPVTRVFLFLSTALMALCSFDIVSPFSLYLNWTLVIEELQLWRLVTCFLFFGTFGLHFFWSCYILLLYCSSLEEVAFCSRSADFLWMLFCSGAMLLGLSYALGIASFFFGSALINVMTYVWGRRNPNTTMAILFFTVKAPYFAWVLCGLSLLVGLHVVDYILGIFVGHVYYFFEDVYPLMPTSKGFRLFKTPRVLRWLLGQRDE